MRTLLLTLAALSAAPLTPPGSLVDARAATPVKAWGDLVVWSAWDPRERLVRLQQLRDGAIAALPTAQPASEGPIDVDVGPDRLGRPLLVLARAGRLFAQDGLTRRVRLLPPPPPGTRDAHPTAWRGRLAWVRADAAGRERVLLADDPGDPPGVPPAGSATGTAAAAAAGDAARTPSAADAARTSSAGDAARTSSAADAGPFGGARAVSAPGGLVGPGEQVAELELAGSRLAAVTTKAGRPGAAPRTRLRVANLATGRVQTAAAVGGGADRRTLVGASFVRGTLRWRVSCPAGETCPGETGAYARDLATRTTAFAPATGEAAGWAALPDGGAVQAGATATAGADAPAALGCFDPRTSAAAFSCPVTQVAPLRFALR